MLRSVRYCTTQRRQFSVSTIDKGKHNFTKFIWYKRGTKQFVKKEEENPDPRLPKYPDGVREVGYKVGKKYVVVPEQIPEIIVPDLTDFELKPYVSYKVADIKQEEFTPEDLFNAVYRSKLESDFKMNNLDENGNSLEPSKDELLTADEASNNARKTGSDIFDSVKKWKPNYIDP